MSVLGAAAYLGYNWYDRSRTYDPVRQQFVFAPHFGADETTAMFAAALESRSRQGFTP